MISFYMKNLIHLVREIPKNVKNIGRKIGIGVLGTSLLGLVSCATMTEAQKITMAGNALMLSSQYSNNSKDARNAVAAGSLLTIYGEMQQELDVAKEGKPETNVTVINNPPVSYNQNKEQENNYTSSNETSAKEEIQLMNHAYIEAPLGRKIEIVNEFKKIKAEAKDPQVTLFIDSWLNQFAPPGFFMYKKWIDFNEDKAGNFGEYIGLNEFSLDISNLGSLHFSFFGGGSKVYDGSYSFNIWNMDEGKLIDSVSDTYDGNFIRDLEIVSSKFHKTGKYKAVLNTANGETFSRDFEITGLKTNYEAVAPKGLFVYNEWKDLNGNKKHEKNEFSGLGKKVFNLDEEDMRVGLNVPNVTGEVIFKSYTENGELLGETIHPSQEIKWYWTGPNASQGSSRDFIDEVKNHGIGKYRITAVFKNNPSENYYVDFEVIK